MKLLPISGAMQVADLFTKGLPLSSFQAFLPKLGMLDISHPPACGGLIEHKDHTRDDSRVMHEGHCTMHEEHCTNAEDSGAMQGST